jgi:Zinc finger, C2H2 type.
MKKLNKPYYYYYFCSPYTPKMTMSLPQIIHEKDRPYVCSLCGKTFARPDTYKLHMKRHDGYRPYACHICSRTFTQAYHYRNHMDIHNNSNTNICTICDKSFSDRGSLNRHRRKVRNILYVEPRLFQLIGTEGS